MHGTPHSRHGHCLPLDSHAPDLMCAQDHPQGPVGSAATPGDYYHAFLSASSEMPQAAPQLFPDSRPLPIG